METAEKRCLLIRVRETAQVSIPIPDDVRLIPPAHWSPELAASAHTHGWIAYYALDREGRSWIDWEPYSSTPRSIPSPPLEAIAALAPEWFDASDYTRASLRVGVWFDTRPHVEAE